MDGGGAGQWQDGERMTTTCLGEGLGGWVMGRLSDPRSHNGS